MLIQANLTTFLFNGSSCHQQQFSSSQ